MKNISDKEIHEFIKTVWAFYRKEGRHDLAWRRKTDPYSIVLSEIMLQQTQVARVEGYFKNWKKVFPTWKKLSKARLSEVLIEWQGLGYNRRGKYLHDIAKQVMTKHGGKFPHNPKEIRDLPGIGSYTQAAIQAFSFNERAILVETNIRTAIIYHFFMNEEQVTESTITQVLESCYRSGTKAYKNPREWNWALMDYGSHLKSEVGNLNKRSKAYTKQSRFEGSRRQLRSGILRFILDKKMTTRGEIIKASGQTGRDADIKELLTELEKEGMIVRDGKSWKSI